NRTSAFKPKPSQQGFTLIELIVVIVILGILAVTAAPKFISFTSDARVSALSGLKGGIAGAMQVVYAKSAIDGKEGTESTTASNVPIAYGYPKPTSAAMLLAASIASAVDGASDFVYVETLFTGTGTSFVPGILHLYPSALFTTTKDVSAVETAACFVKYVGAANVDTPPIVTMITTGCDG
ncbi:MAG: MSHA pilin protein MshA, partial [Alteromonadaceae bacterium]